jgi:hypothetical protein
MQHKKNMGKKFIRLSFCRVLYIGQSRPQDSQNTTDISEKTIQNFRVSHIMYT